MIPIKKILIFVLFFSNAAWAQSICTPEQRIEANSYVAQANQMQRNIKDTPAKEQQYRQEELDLAKKAIALCPNETQLYILEPIITAERRNDEEPAKLSESARSHLYVVEYCTPENRIKTTELLFKTFHFIIGNIAKDSGIDEVTLSKIINSLLTEAITFCPDDHLIQVFQAMILDANIPLTKAAYSQFLQKHPPEMPEVLMVLCTLQEKDGESPAVWQACYQQADKMYENKPYSVDFARVMAALFAENPQAETLRTQYLSSKDPNIAFYQPFLQPEDFQWQKWQGKFRLIVSMSLGWEISSEQNFPSRDLIEDTFLDSFKVLAAKILAEKNQDAPSGKTKQAE